MRNYEAIETQYDAAAISNKINKFIRMEVGIKCD